MAKKIKVTGNREVTSNLPIIPNKEVDGGIPTVYLFEVETYKKEVEVEKRDGSPNRSIFAGSERPTLAFRFKAVGNEDGESRDRVHIVRIYPVDNISSKGKPFTEKEQIDLINAMIDNIVHIHQAFDTPLAVNYREFPDIDFDADAACSNDVEKRIKAYEDLFEAVSNHFNGSKKGEKPIFVGSDKDSMTRYVPLYLKIVANTSGKQFEVPNFVRKGYIEPVRFKNNVKLPPQIYIDFRWETLDLKTDDSEQKTTAITDSQAASSIKNDLNLD